MRHPRSPLLLLALALTACGGGRTDRPPLPEDASLKDKIELKVGIEAFDEGRLSVARHQLQRVAKEAGPDVAAHARLYLGRIISQEDAAKGSLHLDALAGELPPGPLRIAARAYGAESAARAGQCAQARTGATAVEAEIIGRTRADLMIALASCEEGMAALTRLDDGARAAESAKYEAGLRRARLASVEVVEALPASEHAAATALVAGGPLAGAASRLPTGDPVIDPADPALDPDQSPTVVAGDPPPPGPPIIGVMLPLSGRSKPLGERLQGVLALVTDEDQPGTPPRVILTDVGSAEKATAALAELEEASGLTGVIAVLDRATAEALGPRLGAIGAPVIAMTLSQGVLEGDAPVWRGLHTPPLVARSVAGAGLSAGGRRAVILYPEIPYGQGLARLFEQSWEAGGGQVVISHGWSPKKPNIKAMVRALKGREFDTLFLPAPPQAAGGLLSHLAAEAGVWSKSASRSLEGRKGVREVMVLGVPEWYDPRIIAQAGRYVDGARFPVPYAAEIEGGGRFAGRYTARHNRIPTAFEAMLMDAIGALGQAHHAARSTAVSVASALNGSRYRGASVGFDFSKREAVPSLYMLEITKDGFRPVSP